MRNAEPKFYRVFNTETEKIEDGSPVIGPAAAWICSVYFGWQAKQYPYFAKIRLEEICNVHPDVRKVDCTECKKEKV